MNSSPASLRLCSLLIWILLTVTCRSASAQNGVCFKSASDYTFTSAPGKYLNGFTNSDFNNDGNIDVLGVGPYGLSLMLGNGKGNLSAAMNTEVGNNLYSALSEDFNEDGNMDIAVIDLSIDLLMVFFGDGNGSFSTPIGLAIVSDPRSLISADFNLDSNIDLATTNSGSNNISVLLGDGAGNFTEPTEFDVGESPYAVAKGDFNLDGKIDLATANLSVTNNLSVLLGDGMGNFATAVNYSIGINNASIASADFNGDGLFDLAVGNLGVSTISIMISDGTGTFSLLSTLSSSEPRSITSRDLNNDQKVDLIAIGDLGISVLRGDGQGGFTNGPEYSSGGLVVSVADYNNDGVSDMGAVTSGNMAILLGDHEGHFLGNESVPLNFIPYSITKADFNGDGKMDIVATDNASDEVVMILGNGIDGFSLSMKYAAGLTPTSITSNDFNSDGKMDIALASNEGNNIAVLLGDGLGGLSLPIYYPAGAISYLLLSSDFNGDGRADLATGNNGPSLSVLFGDGMGRFGPPLMLTLDNFPFSISASDFNDDGKFDLAVVIDKSDDVFIFMASETGNFDSPQNHYMGLRPRIIKGADLNGDGRHDLVAVNQEAYNRTSLAIILNNGTGLFSRPVYFANGSTISQIIIDDFNKDTRADVAAVEEDHVSVYLGNGSGNFAQPGNFKVGISPIIVSSDFTSDGQIDIVCSSVNSLILLDNNTAFVTVQGITSFCPGGSVTLQGNKEGYTYNWSQNAGNTKNIIVTQGGTYHVTISNQNESCISTSNEVTVSVPPNPPAFSATQPACESNEGSVMVQKENSDDTYSFDNGLTFQLSNIKTGLAPGTYKVIARTSSGCNSLAASVVLLPVVVPSTPITIVTFSDCNTANGTINVVKQADLETYSFDNGTTFQTNSIVSDLPPGSFNVIIKSSTGCHSPTNQAYVGVNKPPLSEIKLTQPTCTIPTGQAVVTIINDNDIYSFDNGITFQSSNVKFELIPGVHEVIVKNSGDCVSIPMPITIVDPPIIPAIPTLMLTQPSCGTASGSVIVIAQEVNERYSFDNGLTYEISNSKSGLTAGAYNVTIKSSDGCISPFASATINLQPITPFAPKINTVQPNCNLLTGSISVTVQQANETYSFDSGLTYQTSNTQSGLTAGTYDIKTKSDDGCSSVASQVIINLPPATPAKPVITADLTNPDAPTLTVNSGDIFQWYKNGVAIPDEMSQTIAINEAGSYTAVVSNFDGCSSEPSDPMNIIITGLEESNDFPKVELFPNPAADQLGIYLTGFDDSDEVGISIVSMLGKSIETITSTTNPMILLSIADYAPGQYILHVRQRQKIVGILFVKK